MNHALHPNATLTSPLYVRGKWRIGFLATTNIKAETKLFGTVVFVRSGQRVGWWMGLSEYLAVLRPRPRLEHRPVIDWLIHATYILRCQRAEEKNH